MYYQINVALNGQHFFETDKKSIRDKPTMEKVYKVFKEKFPLAEGYDVIVSHYDTVGKFIDTSYLDNGQRQQLKGVFMMKALTEKQMHTRLNNYYKAHYGENDEDGFYVNPAPNKWKFERNEKIIILVCDEFTGKVTEE